MSGPDHLTTPQGRRIAYHQTAGQGPGVVFLGGFKSDMQGTKAVYLQDWAERNGRAFLRFDYSGHGQSSGDFLAGAIGDWFEDARAAVTALTEGPQGLVGSSMGGWIGWRVWRGSRRHLTLPKTACGKALPRHSGRKWRRRGRWLCRRNIPMPLTSSHEIGRASCGG